MTKLVVDGKDIEDQQDILAEQAKFYENLYSTEKNISFSIKNNSDIVINDTQKVLLDSEITVDECKEALFSFADEKAPGSDGLTAELYKKLWPELADIIMELYAHCIKMRRLNESARLGIISLLPKGNKDPTLLKNWRPLTLLNMDYKILAKVLATRLKLVLPSIIGPQQTGFLEDRYIAENIRKTIDVVTYANKYQKKMIIVSLDFEKCFDRIEYTSIMGSLRYFGIGDRFIEWSKLFFTDFEVRTQNAGHFSKKFVKTRSVNQGCPISPYYYLLVGEIMAHQLLGNTQIKAFKIRDIKMLLAQFADDTIIFLEFDEISLKETLSTLEFIRQKHGAQNLL